LEYVPIFFATRDARRKKNNKWASGQVTGQSGFWIIIHYLLKAVRVLPDLKEGEEEGPLDDDWDLIA
jgi:hypothetical protein